MNPRTILFVDASPVLGGATRVLLDLLDWLDPAQVRGVVVCRAGSPVEERLRSLGHATVGLRLPTLTFSGGPAAISRMARDWIRVQGAIARSIRGHRPVVVHATGLASVLIAGLPARRAGVPLLWHAHELLPRVRSMALPVQVAGRLARSIVCVSEAARRRLVDLGAPVDACQVVYNTVPGSRREQLAGIGPPLPSSPAVLAIGTLAPLKGQHLLVEAAAILAPDHPGLRVDIVGEVAFERDRAYARELRAEVERRGLRDVVRFLGFQDDVPGLLERATVVAHASPEEEAFGLVPLEAMAAGRPVVASRVGGVAEVVEDGISGILVEPGSGAALADAIGRLLDDPELRERLGTAGRRIAAERFGAERMRAGIEAVLAPLAGGAVFRSVP